MKRMNRIGHVAKCERGWTGLVLSKTWKIGVRKVMTIYRGVCLDTGRVGNKWESRRPSWIGTLDDWVHSKNERTKK